MSEPVPLPRAFVDPSSVAVVGATEDRAKWGYWLASGALAASYRRRVWLVNHRAPRVLGQSCYASVNDLPQAPELVVLSVPSRHVLAVVGDALAKGCRAFLGITAGLGADEAAVAALLARAGARMIGPNSLGLFVGATDLRLAWGSFTAGTLAIVSQSGQVGSEIADLGARAGLGVSRFYSVGNQLDVTAADVLESLADDERTTTVALYLESFADGPRIVAALRALRRAGKHALVLATGASDGSRRLARSHTGSMTSALAVVDAACRAAGALRVATPRDLVDLASVLQAADLPHGPAVAVISDSGGQGGIAADVAADQGLRLPVFSAGVQAGLRAVLPPEAAVANPVDLSGGGEADLTTYAKVVELLAASGEVDSIVLSGYFGRYGEHSPGLVDAELAVVDRLPSDTPLIVHSMSTDSAAVARLRERGIPTFDTIDAALGALGRAVRLGEHPGRDLTTASDVTAPAPGYWAAREFVRALGIPVARACRVTDVATVTRACESLRPPLVLKAGWIEHKREADAVKTGLTPDTAVAALEEMCARLGPGDYVLEEQDTRRDVVEMLIGARWDRDFGLTVAVGHGGTEAELWQDVVVELAPVDRATAAGMLDRLRSRRLLDGWRGSKAVDVDALVDAIVVLSQATAGEVEVNPIRVGPDGVIAVDALVLAAQEDSETTKETA
ncbi:acetate--CoA ligase family protein [Umezawaea sp. NPDC059074]|uniref:acetate--CoA ligase family protein n=1 Tax=Umezawaea sp. NPDC059074 TaxID=3346716 RepID=UPI00367B0FD9